MTNNGLLNRDMLSWQLCFSYMVWYVPAKAEKTFCSVIKLLPKMSTLQLLETAWESPNVSLTLNNIQFNKWI